MSSTQGTLVIIDDQFEKIEGHPYEYNKSVGQIFEARGWDVVMYGDSKLAESIQQELRATPWFVFNPSAAIRKIPIAGPILYRFGFWKRYRQQMDALLGKVAREQAKPLVFVPNVYWYNVLPIAQSLKKATVQAAILYRISIFDTIRVPAVMKPFILPLISYAVKQIRKNTNVHFFSDSDVIADEWEKRFAVPMGVLPIPHLATNMKAKSWREGQKVRMYLPGGMRLEKGAQVLTEAFELLAAQQPDVLQRLVLVTQYFGNDRALQSFKDRLGALPLENVFLGSLSSEAYNNELCDADVILIPYQASEGYRARTSGILAEAIASSKPFITTEGTWMSVQAHKFETGMTFADNSATDLASAIISITNSYLEYADKANRAAARWMMTQSKDVYFQKLSSAE